MFNLFKGGTKKPTEAEALEKTVDLLSIALDLRIGIIRSLKLQIRPRKR